MKPFVPTEAACTPARVGAMAVRCRWGFQANTVVCCGAGWTEQSFVSLAVVPPHLQIAEQAAERRIYEQQLREAGADWVLNDTEAVLSWKGAAA